VTCKVETYGDGQSRGIGYVQFQTKDEATTAIQQMNDKEVEGKKLIVMQHVKKFDRSGSPGE